MNTQRINEIYADYRKALGRLGEALNEDLAKGSIVVDGAIQRFEFTFELAWKLAKAILAYGGIEAATPRLAIKEAYKTKLLANGDVWIDMLEDRNKTAHIYDEAGALVIYHKLNGHFQALSQFADTAGKYLQSF